MGKLHAATGKLAKCEGRPEGGYRPETGSHATPPRRAVAALAMGEPRFVTFDVIDATSKKPTTVIINDGGKEWSPKAAQDRLLAAIKLESEQHRCGREDWPALARILRRLASDIDAGAQMMALQDKYVDVGSLAQAERVTRIIPVSGEVVR